MGLNDSNFFLPRQLLHPSLAQVLSLPPLCLTLGPPSCFRNLRWRLRSRCSPRRRIELRLSPRLVHQPPPLRRLSLSASKSTSHYIHSLGPTVASFHSTISDTTPDLTNDSSYSVISPDSHQSEEVVSPVTATDLAPVVPPTRSPTPSVRSVRDSVNATVSRPPSRRQSTPRVRHASLLPPSVPITPLEPVANASMAVAAPVTPRGNPSSAGKTSSVSSESSVSHSSRSKSSRTKGITLCYYYIFTIPLLTGNLPFFRSHERS